MCRGLLIFLEFCPLRFFRLGLFFAHFRPAVGTRVGIFERVLLGAVILFLGFVKSSFLACFV